MDSIESSFQSSVCKYSPKDKFRSSFSSSRNQYLVRDKFTLCESSSHSEVKQRLEKMNFTCVKPLGRGGTSEVLSAVTPQNEEVAIKVVKSTLFWSCEKEELIWPSLEHPNILPLYEILDFKDMNLKLYVMPKHPATLEKRVRSSQFLADPHGLERIRKYLRNSIDGIRYLHDSGFVHLDTKSDNVLITVEDTAVLCDFSGVDCKRSPCKRLVAPHVYRPPESFNPSENNRLDNAAFDVWTYAFMSLNVLTGHWPLHRMKEVIELVKDDASWKSYVEPVLVELLEADTFFRIMRSSLPAVRMTEEDVRLAHDFVCSMMQWDPRHRPTAQLVQKHPFLSVADGQKEISVKVERDVKKVLNSERRKVSYEIDENSVSPVTRMQSINRSFKEKEGKKAASPVLEGRENEYIFSGVEAFEENSTLILVDERIRICLPSEKHASDFVPVKNVSSKRRKTLVRRIKVWIAKKWNILLNARNN